MQAISPRRTLNQRTRLRYRLPWTIQLSLVLLIIWNGTTSALADEPLVELEHAWETLPNLPVVWFPKDQLVSARLKVSDLRSSSTRARYDAAYAALEQAQASSGALPPNQSLLEELLGCLERGEPNVRVRQLLMAAAGKWLDESNSQRFWSIALKDESLLQPAQRALIAIRSNAAAEFWRKQLESSEVGYSSLHLALKGLAFAGNSKDLPNLRRVVLSSTLPIGLRQQAADTIGQIAKSGEIEFAKRILKDVSESPELLASFVLQNHHEPDAAPTLQQILSSGSGAAKRLAFRALSICDPLLARNVGQVFLVHDDALLREQVLLFMQSIHDTESLILQAKRLADSEAKVRRLARTGLLSRCLADTDSRKVVDNVVTQALTAKSFEAAEQAILLVVELRDTTRFPQLISLLDHPHPDVNIRAAWALSVLDSDPETVVALERYARSWTDRYEADPKSFPDSDSYKLSYLFEGFGRKKHRDAIPLLKRYVPKANKDRLPAWTRVAAIWALGQLYEAQSDEPLREQLESRFSDTTVINGENLQVRFASGLALGAVGNKSSLDTLEAFLSSPGDPLHEAANWAINRIRSRPGVVE